MPLKNNIPVSHMPVGKPTLVDPSTNPILIKNFSPQPDPVPRTPVPAPSTGGTRVPQTGGGRSGIGRLQKAGMPGVPSTPGGYDSSGINPSAGRPRVPSTGGTLPPRQRTTPKTGGTLPPKQRPAGSIRERMMSKLGKLPGRGRRYNP